MKKVSTVGTRQGRNISQQKLTIGLDLGDRNSCYCVLGEAGQIQLEQRARTTGKALQEVFGALPGSRTAMEIGTHSFWFCESVGLKLLGQTWFSFDLLWSFALLEAASTIVVL